MRRNVVSHQMLSLGGLLLTLVVLIVSSCSSGNSPVAPNPSSLRAQPLTLRPEAFGILTLGPARNPSLRTKPVAITQHVVAATGGTVSLSGTLLRSTYTYSLTFPPGALAQDTDVTISVPDDAQILMDLGPYGLTFNSPVTFQMQVDMADLGLNFGILKKTLDIYWYNDTTTLWEGQGATLSKKGSKITATVPLAHFSRYAMGGDQTAQ